MSPDLRNDPGTVTIPQYRFNKTNQHKVDPPTSYLVASFKVESKELELELWQSL